MSSHSCSVEQLDVAVTALLAGTAPAVNGDAELAQLMQIGDDLRSLPRPEFKVRLRTELEAPVSMRSAASVQLPVPPSLLPNPQSAYPVRGMNFLASLALHAAALAVLLTSGYWFVQAPTSAVRQEVTSLILPDVYLPPLPKEARGGGGGGDRDVLEASRGGLPRSAREQIAPPAVVIRNDAPKLSVEPTIVAPPMKAPDLAQLGDPLAGVTGPPSSGIGSGGGIGSGDGGGVGSGRGPGVGPGWGGGFGGGAYRVGGGVSAPRALHSPEPEYSDEARKVKLQGTVVLWLIVGPDGRAHQVKVARSLGMGLDEKALEAVRRWRFEPATLDGRAVPVQINVEVNFRLY